MPNFCFQEKLFFANAELPCAENSFGKPCPSINVSFH